MEDKVIVFTQKDVLILCEEQVPDCPIDAIFYANQKARRKQYIYNPDYNQWTVNKGNIFQHIEEHLVPKKYLTYLLLVKDLPYPQRIPMK